MFMHSLRFIAVAGTLAGFAAGIACACSGGTPVGVNPSPTPTDPPAVAVDPLIARLMADLNHDQFTVREQAMAELQRIGKAVVPALRQTLASQPPAEVRHRAERVLQQLGEPIVQQPPAKAASTTRAYMGCGTYSGRTLTPVQRQQPGDERLGVRLEKPADVVALQLDLPAGQGLVIQQVQADSAAAKAGLKTLDILLEINGKPVPSDPAAFTKLLTEIKVNTPVDAVVLRKGRKETVKGLTVPEARAVVAPVQRVNYPADMSCRGSSLGSVK